MSDDENRPFAPDWAVPPGETLKDFLVDRGWNAREACTRLGWRLSLLVRVLESDVGIDPALAADLSRTFGNSTTFWLNIQKHYDEWLIRQP